MDCGGIYDHFLQIYLMTVITLYIQNFIKKILPIHNRLADGPSVEMIKKIKKLIIGKNLDFTLKQEHRIIKKNNNLYLNKKLKNKKIDYIFSAIANIYKENVKKDFLLINMINNKILTLKSLRNKNILFELRCKSNTI